MFIEVEQIYHPDMMNFYFKADNEPQMYASYADFENKGEGLTQILMNLKGIKRVLLLKNLLFVEKEEKADWEMLSAQIMAEISDFDFENMVQPSLKDSEKLKMIEALIESQVRSFLVRDGGNLSVIDFQDGVLFVRLEGHCKGCPHAEVTLKNVIESVLKKYLPFVKAVQKGD